MQTYSVIIQENFQHNEIFQMYQVQYLFPNMFMKDIYVSRAPKHAIDLTPRAIQGVDFLVVVGDNSLLREVGEGLIPSASWNRECQVYDVSVPILYIPSGYFQDMGANMNYFEPVQEYVNSALNEISVHDMFRCNDELFCYVAAGGFLTNVPYSFSFKQKALFNKNDYFLKAFEESFKTAHKYKMKICLDGLQYEGEYVAFFVTNTHSLGGFPIFSKSRLDDQKCEIMLIKDFNNLKAFLELYKKLKKEEDLNSLSFADYYQAREVCLTMDDSYFNYSCLDGCQSKNKTGNIQIKPYARLRVMKGKKDF